MKKQYDQKINYFEYSLNKSNSSRDQNLANIKLRQKNFDKVYKKDYPEQNIIFTGTLKAEQDVVIEKIIRDMNKHKYSLLSAPCIFGKTVMAIYLACKYKIKTLFLVNYISQENKIIDMVKSMTNLTGVGLIQKNKVDIDYPISVGIPQSLSRMDHIDEILQDFGMIVVTQDIPMGSTFFSRLCQKMTPKYCLIMRRAALKNNHH